MVMRSGRYDEYAVHQAVRLAMQSGHLRQALAWLNDAVEHGYAGKVELMRSAVLSALGKKEEAANALETLAVGRDANSELDTAEAWMMAGRIDRAEAILAPLVVPGGLQSNQAGMATMLQAMCMALSGKLGDGKSLAGGLVKSGYKALGWSFAEFGAYLDGAEKRRELPAATIDELRLWMRELEA
jgi:hypothetical protein